MENRILLQASERLGSQRKLAILLGVTESAVSQVRKGRRPIPVRWCPLIEAATRGAVRCEDMRPDIEWGALRYRRPRKTEEA